MLRESLNQPLMVIFEDLHWIDEETQAFLNLLADSIGTAKVLLLLNYRPEYSHSWGSKTYYTQLRLDPLGRESAEEMLSALLGDGKELIPLKRLIIEKTQGGHSQASGIPTNKREPRFRSGVAEHRITNTARQFTGPHPSDLTLKNQGTTHIGLTAGSDVV